MIDTSAFERTVYVTEVDNDSNCSKVAFKNQKGDVVKSYKYRTRKVKQPKEEVNER